LKQPFFFSLPAYYRLVWLIVSAAAADADVDLL
jgi:hypothetical protein